MDESKRVIASTKSSIHRYFASCSFPSTVSSRHSSIRKSSNFRITEAIYQQDKAKFVATIPLQPVKLPRISQRKRSPKYKSMPRFEPKASRSRRKHTAGSLSPKKPMTGKMSSGCLLDGYPHSLTNSWEPSKELLNKSSHRLASIKSLQPVLSEKVGTVIEKCKGMERSSSQLDLLRKEQKLAQSLESFINVTERTLEQIDTAPGELLEPMYTMKREADTSILLDAQLYVKEDRGNLNEATNKINRMIEREARHRRYVDKDG